jgi:hypothetical protein
MLDATVARRRGIAFAGNTEEVDDPPDPATPDTELDTPMSGHLGILSRVGLGASAGFAGTLVLQGLMTAGRRWWPETLPPLRQDPGEFMVEQAEARLPASVRARVPEVVEAGVAGAMAIGYGLAFGAAYAALRPRGGSAWLDGAALGVACWAAGYAGWLPAAGLMPPLRRQTGTQALAPAAEHVAYGMATVAAYNWLNGRAGHETGRREPLYPSWATAG